MNLNKVFIAGRVAQAPELRSTQSGQPVATMTVATNRTWTGKDGVKQEVAEFHPVVMWGKLAQTCAAYLEKGSLVLVEGRMETRTWTNKQGQQQRTTEIIAQEVQFGPKPTAPAAAAREAKLSETEKRSNGGVQPSLDGDEADTGRSFEPAFGDDKDDIGEPPF